MIKEDELPNAYSPDRTLPWRSCGAWLRPPCSRPPIQSQRAAWATATSSPSTTPGRALEIPLLQTVKTRCCGRRRGRRRCFRMRDASTTADPFPSTTPDGALDIPWPQAPGTASTRCCGRLPGRRRCLRTRATEASASPTLSTTPTRPLEVLDHDRFRRGAVVVVGKGEGA